MMDETTLQKIATSLFAVILFYILGFNHANADIYKWTDSNGTVHYSDEPPQDKRLKASTMQLRSTTRRQEAAPADKPASTDSGSAAQPESQDADKDSNSNRTTPTTPSEVPKPAITTAGETELAAAEQAKQAIGQTRRERCLTARQNIAVLAKEMPVYYDSTGKLRPNWARDTATGEREYLEDSERKTAQEQAEKTIKDSCEKPDDAAEQEEVRKKWVRSEYCQLNRSILSELQSGAIAVSQERLKKQQDLTDEYCDGSASTSSSEFSVIEIFPKNATQNEQSDKRTLIFLP